MPYLKIDDAWFDSPGVAALSRCARLTAVEFRAYANRVLSDGFVPAQMARRISDSPDVDADVAELVEANMLEPTTRVGIVGWQVSGWSDEQDAAEDIRRRQKLTRDRQARHRRHLSGDHAECDPDRCHALRNALGNPSGSRGQSNASPPSSPASPLHSRRASRGSGDGEVVGIRRAPRSRASAVGVPTPPAEPTVVEFEDDADE